MIKIKYILKGIVATLLLMLSVTSCESYNVDVIDELLVDRAFSPIDVKTFVRNQTNVELNWTVREGVDHYVVEFSADDETFSTIFKTVNVTPAELPVTVALEGETVYSIRVKAVSAKGLEDSKWVLGKVTTQSEQLFLASVDGDIASKEATLRWLAGSNVTKIVLTPGDITHTITAEEKASGIAIVTGLNAETSYQANLFNGTKKRGTTTFATGIDIGDGILVKNTEDLLVVIANANSGAKLFLEPGDYKSFGVDGVTPSTDITLAKSITISGIPGKARPVLHYKITANVGTSNISLLNLDLDGRVYNTNGVLENIANASVLTFSAAGTFGDILISGCIVHDFTRSLLANTASTAIARIASFTVENSIIKNVNTNAGADFIDVRYGYINNIVLQNSTFDTCSNTRDFIRIDAATGLSGTGLSTNILIDGCTLNNVSNSTVVAGAAGKRILYLRFVSNSSVVRNTLITNTTAVYNNSTVTNLPTFSNNNYFNALNFKDSAIKDNRADATGSALDPGFANAATGDFTISNPTLKDNKIGDPRWIK